MPSVGGLYEMGRRGEDDRLPSCLTRLRREAVIRGWAVVTAVVSASQIHPSGNLGKSGWEVHRKKIHIRTATQEVFAVQSKVERRGAEPRR